MRRMMHAALITSALFSTVAISSATFAQSQQNSLLVNRGGKAVQYSAPSASGTSEYPGQESYSNNTVYSEVEQGTHYSQESYIQGHEAAPQFLKYGSCRPHSSIATLMQRDYSSRNLWAGYAQERAALVGHMMRHVDGTCDCCQTHDQACYPNGSQAGGACSTGCGPGIGGNRYKLSTLHSSPTSDCGTGTCSTGACGGGLGQKIQGWKHSARPFTFGAPADPYCGSCSTENYTESNYSPAPQQASPYQAAPQQQPVPQPIPQSAQGQQFNQTPYRTR